LYIRFFFLSKAQLSFFHFLKIVIGWLVPSAARQKIPAEPGWHLQPQKIHLLKIGFFRQVRELKIQRKNPGSVLCR
jgi:hypothetical protein